MNSESYPKFLSLKNLRNSLLFGAKIKLVESIILE
jgi:hypothetical protein